MDAVEARELTRAFGRHTAVDRLTCRVETGTVLGLVGPAGSGKTTVLRMLAALLPPTGGDAFIAGASIRHDVTRVRRLVGYLPQAFGSYPDLTVVEYMDFFASCYHIPPRERAALSNDLLQLVDLAHRRNDPVDRLSPGAMKRLALARTLAHDPQVLLLDQPTQGLDPRARVELRELIRELLNMNKAVLIASSGLAEIEDLCTHIAVIDRGRLVFSGTREAVRARVRPHRILSVRFFGDVSAALNSARAGPGVLDARLAAPDAGPGMENGSRGEGAQAAPGLVNLLKEMRIAFSGDYTGASELLRHLLRSGVQVVSFSEQTDALAALLAASNATYAGEPRWPSEDSA